MFSVGQRVWHRNGQRSGTVVECDGERVYIAQDNGVEVDFRASDLTAKAPDGATPARILERGEAPGAASLVPVRTLTPRDITPEHLNVLDSVPVRTLQAIAAVYERKKGAGKFSALDAAAKLNAIADITDVPYRTMRGYLGRPGELGLVMGKGLADRSKSV
jgi:hypothetical protein